MKQLNFNVKKLRRSRYNHSLRFSIIDIPNYETRGYIKTLPNKSKDFVLHIINRKVIPGCKINKDNW